MEEDKSKEAEGICQGVIIMKQLGILAEIKLD